MYAFANSPFHSERSRRDGLILATIVAGHVILVAALNAGLRLPDLPRLPTWSPIRHIPEPVPPIDTVATNRPEGPIAVVPQPRAPDVPLEVSPGPEGLPEAPLDQPLSYADSGAGRAGPVRLGPQPDARLLASGRWSPEMPASERRAAREAGDLGYTVVRCVVGVNGRCLRVSILESSGNQRLDGAALRHATRVWKFAPASLDGERVEGSYDLKVIWRVVD